LFVGLRGEEIIGFLVFFIKIKCCFLDIYNWEAQEEEKIDRMGIRFEIDSKI